MKALFPSYKNGLVNFSSSLEKFFGILPKYSSLRKVDQLLREEDYDNIIVLVYNGMSSNLLTLNTKDDSIYSKNKIFDLTSTIDTVFITDDIEDRGDSANFYEMLIKQINLNTDYNAYGVLPYGLGACEDDKEAYQRIINLANSNGKKFIYAYFEDLQDSIIKHGNVNIQVNDKLNDIEKNILKVTESVSNSLILVTGNYGYVDNKALYFKDYPEINDLIDDVTVVNNRSFFINIKNSDLESFRILFTKAFKNDFLLLTKEQAVFRKIIDSSFQFVGDFMIIANGDKFFDFFNQHLSACCGGLSEQEMMMPVVVIKKKLHKEFIRPSRMEDYSMISLVMMQMQKDRVLKRKDIFLNFCVLSKSDFVNLCDRNVPSTCFVYEVNEEVVGFVIVRLKSVFGDKKYSNHNYVNIEYIYVSEDYRRQKIATKLYQEVLKYAKKLHFKKVEFALWYFDSIGEEFVLSLGPKLLHKNYEIYL